MGELARVQRASVTVCVWCSLLTNSPVYSGGHLLPWLQVLQKRRQKTQLTLSCVWEGRMGGENQLMVGHSLKKISMRTCINHYVHTNSGKKNSLRWPYTWVNKHIRLFPKLQGNMRLIMKAKIDHTPKPWRLFGSTCTWQKSRVVEIVDILPL